MSTFGILVVGSLLAFKLIIHTWLILRQRSTLARHRAAVPADFNGHFSIDEHQKGVDYGRARLGLGLGKLWFGAGVMGLWFYSGALNTLDSLLFLFIPSSLWQPLALIATVMLVGGLLELPWSIYSQFVVEERFGFNRTSWRTFVADRIKGLVIGGIFGLALGFPLVFLMHTIPGYWWIPAAAVYISFQFILLLLFPTVIAPLFNKFSPLTDEKLATSLKTMVEEAGFRSDGVFVMDASKRSSHGNAYFTGIGAAKRIVFFDTLLKSLTPAQTLAVLAHEIGHLAHGHIKKGMALSLLMSVLTFAAIGWFSTRADLFIDLGLTPTHGVLLITAMWLGGLVSVPLSPLFSLWSRRHEFEADRYAVARSEKDALSTALMALYRENAGSLVVDPIYAAWYYSHPPLAERIAAMRAAPTATPVGN
ncbi:MAG: M48 family metallopeptidase [Bacteriovoracia bacterium]